MEEDGDVSVPTISTSITEDESEDLCLMIDPMATSHNYGIALCFPVTVLCHFMIGLECLIWTQSYCQLCKLHASDYKSTVLR